MAEHSGKFQHFNVPDIRTERECARDLLKAENKLGEVETAFGKLHIDQDAHEKMRNELDACARIHDEVAQAVQRENTWSPESRAALTDLQTRTNALGRQIKRLG